MSLVIAHTDGWMVEDRRIVCDGVFLPAKESPVKIVQGLGFLAGFVGKYDWKCRVDRFCVNRSDCVGPGALGLICEAAQKLDKDDDSDALVLTRDNGNHLFHVSAGGSVVELDAQCWAIGYSNMARGWLAGLQHYRNSNFDEADAQECIRWVSTQTGAVSAESTVVRLTG